MKVVDPATGELFANVLDDTPETIAAKVAAARAAQPGWAARPLGERIEPSCARVPGLGGRPGSTSWPPP